MAAVLLTGMSGAGKSAVLAELGALGYEDTDTDDGDWVVAGSSRSGTRPG